MGVLFVCYISFVYFAVLNVVTSTFCQTAIEASNNDMDQVLHNHIMMREGYMKRMKVLFEKIDEDGSGAICFQDLASHLDNPEIQAYLYALDIGVVEVQTLFTLLDTDGNDCVELEDFMEGRLRLRGTAKAIDMTKLMHDVKTMRSRMMHLTQLVTKLASHLDVELSGMQDAFRSPMRTPCTPCPPLRPRP